MKTRTKLQPEKTLFYDVDTQRDFIMPGGALYVSGSEEILPVLKEMTELARRCNIRRVCSTDRHFPGDSELSRNGGPWPDHCMDGTEGQRNVAETAPSNPHPLPSHQIGDEELETAINHPGELVIEKQDVNVVVGNANARPLLARLARKYEHVVIYGVYTDVCVDYAVNAMLEHGRVPYVVSDAIYDIDAGNAAAARDRWSQQGVRTLTLRELEQLLDP